MYSYFRGKLAQLLPAYAILDVQGIGYKILIPHSTYTKLIDALNSDTLLYTSFVVRENFQGLYGFAVEDERNLFEVLIEISGVGPKTALNLIGHLSISELQQVILREDTHTLSKVPGIGKKTSERLLVELRNKLDAFFTKSPLDHAIRTPLDPKNQKLQDALKALINLGYNHATAQKALKKSLEFSETSDLSGLIAIALKHV